MITNRSIVAKQNAFHIKVVSGTTGSHYVMDGSEQMMTSEAALYIDLPAITAANGQTKIYIATSKLGRIYLYASGSNKIRWCYPQYFSGSEASSYTSNNAADRAALQFMNDGSNWYIIGDSMRPSVVEV